MQLPAGVHLIRTPVPYPLKFVNCYLIENDQGWALIDAGCNTADTREFWKATLAQYGVAKGQLTDLYVTHFHPDHLGAAGWLQQEWGCRVIMNGPDWEWAQTQWEPTCQQGYLIEQLYRNHGCPSDLASRVREQFIEQRNDTIPLPEQVVTIEVGSVVRLAGVDYDVLALPGHADGMVGYWNADAQVLFAGDAILPHITPNVGLWPRCRANPLGDYLETLRRIERMDPSLTLAGHGKLIENTAERARQILDHHDERLDIMEGMVSSGVQSAVEVAMLYFQLKDLTPHQVRFALGETLAHLEYLVREGRLARNEGGAVQYCPATLLREGG